MAFFVALALSSARRLVMRSNRSGVLLVGAVGGAVVAWACGIADTPPARAQEDCTYTVTFVPTTLNGDGEVDAVTLAAGEEPFSVTLIPGQARPHLAVRRCTP